MSLKASVYNSSATESSDSIREKAPQVYYSQNRMITAEDYQVVPLSASQEIIKVRSVNRSASGISRAKEILDPTGAYSNVLYLQMMEYLYREENTNTFTFTFTNRNTILSTIEIQFSRSKIKRSIFKTFLLFKIWYKRFKFINSYMEFNYNINKYKYRIFYIRW